MQGRLKYDDGKIVLECDSNSIAAMLSCADFLLNTVTERLEKIDLKKLPELESGAVDDLHIVIEDITHYLDSMEGNLEISDEANAWFYKSEDPFLKEEKKRG